jgi:hypothetical protein
MKSCWDPEFEPSVDGVIRIVSVPNFTIRYPYWENIACFCKEYSDVISPLNHIIYPQYVLVTYTACMW